MISQPISRAVDKALRMLAVTYEIQAARWGVSAGSLHRLVSWYHPLEDNPRALERMFEHDKADLRQLDVPIVTQLIGDPPEPRYRLDAARLQLPPVTPTEPFWRVMQSHAPRLQAMADRMPDLPGRDAALLSFALIPVSHEIGVRIPPWDIPRNQLTNARCVLEWVHAILQIAEGIGRRLGPFGGIPVPIHQLAAHTGFPEAFIWHLADRGANRPDRHAAETPVVRIVATSPEEGIGVVSREMRRGWRPRRIHVEHLITWAARDGAPLEPELVRALRSIQRGAPHTPATLGAMALVDGALS